MKTCNALFWILLTGCLIVCLTACVQENAFVEPYASVRLSLKVDFRQPVARSVPLEGIEGRNENRIDALDCFFYPDGSDRETPAVLHLHRDFNDEETDAQIETAISTADFNVLFPDGAKHCRVYAIANRPDDVPLPSVFASVSELKQLVIAEDHWDQNTPPLRFVMDTDGEGVVDHDAESGRLSGTLYLERSVAKISLTVTSIRPVEEEDEDGNKVVWTAHPEAMQVYMNHGVRRSHIDAGLYPYQPTSASDFYDTRRDQGVGYHAVSYPLYGGGESRIWEPVQPFYSFASDWRDDAADEPYLLLVVPWHKSSDAENSYYNCYYQISVHAGEPQLLRNRYYKINLAVSTLGSFVEEQPLTLQPSCVILDWNTNVIDADLEHYRYLMVARDYVVLNNRESVEIPFYTSHDVKIINVSCSHPDLSRNIVTTVPLSPSSYTLKIVDGHLVFHHALNNHYEDEDFDFTPYTLTFRLVHADRTDFFQDVTLIQYPAIYAQADRNSDYRHDWNSNNDNRHHGYAFVNGYYTDYYHYGLRQQDYFGNVPGYVNRNGSPNMYIFTLTSVEGTPYAIGDPREREVSDIVDDPVMYNGYSVQSAWVMAPALDETGKVGNQQRRLRNYYATDGTAATRNRVSPRFRIASAYAVMNTNEYPARRLDAMKKRCAAYQEDGYPAGRWRLPTQAEFQFIMSQVDKGRMPQLYIKGKSYWCAHGIGTPTGDGRIEMNYTNSSSNGCSTRCVYDEWYWSDRLQGKEKHCFTWGDRAR